jgi:hypothetical protein
MFFLWLVEMLWARASAVKLTPLSAESEEAFMHRSSIDICALRHFRPRRMNVSNLLKM